MSKKRSITHFPKLSVYHEESAGINKKTLAPIKIGKLLDKKLERRESRISRFNSIIVSGSPLKLRMRFFTPEPSKKFSYIAKIPHIKLDHQL